jgi:hypothetical protein
LIQPVVAPILDSCNSPGIAALLLCAGSKAVLELERDEAERSMFVSKDTLTSAQLAFINQGLMTLGMKIISTRQPTASPR